MIRQEFIGRTLTVVDASNEDLVGIHGIIIDETKNTLRVRTDRGEKTLLKEQVRIQVDDVLMEGSPLTVRPEKRTKLRIKQWQRKKPQNK